MRVEFIINSWSQFHREQSSVRQVVDQSKGCRAVVLVSLTNHISRVAACTSSAISFFLFYVLMPCSS